MPEPLRPTPPLTQRIAEEAANLLLHIVHLALILFIAVGWLFCATRIWHLALAATVLASWYGLGLLLGKPGGYCVITDLQWRLRERRGKPPPGGGYMKYLTDRITGLNSNAERVDRLSTIGFFATVVAAALLLYFPIGCNTANG